MAKQSIVDLTRNNREHHERNFWGADKKTLRPQVLLSIYINEEREVEEIKVLDEFVGGEYGYNLLNDSNDEWDHYAINGSLPNSMRQPDTLYHVYAAIEHYRCSYEYDEWDSYYEFFNPIKVMTNYRDFINKNEDWIDQQNRKAQDEGISISTDGKVYGKNSENDMDIFYGGSSTKTNITLKDIKDFISIVAEKDIRLAHRFAMNYRFKEALGNKYNKEIENMEETRQELIDYIKRCSDFDTRWNDKGYEIEANGYRFPKGKHFIAFEEINNLTDEILQKHDSAKILDAIIGTKTILEAFDKSL